MNTVPHVAHSSCNVLKSKTLWQWQSKGPFSSTVKWSNQGRTAYKTYKGNIKYKRAAASQLSLGLFQKRRSWLSGRTWDVLKVPSSDPLSSFVPRQTSVWLTTIHRNIQPHLCICVIPPTNKSLQNTANEYPCFFSWAITKHSNWSEARWCICVTCDVEWL